MTSFLIIAPFGAFAALTLVTTDAVSLFAAAGLSLGIVLWDVLRGTSVKILSAGSVLLFSAIGCYVTLIDGNWSHTSLRLAVDLGVLAIAVLSLLIRFPFTLQYAREQVSPEIMKLPGFLQANYIITWAWTAAFMLMLIADLLVVFIPGAPLWIGVAVAFAARNAALYFTKWYPQYRRANHEAAKQTTPPAKT